MQSVHPFTIASKARFSYLDILISGYLNTLISYYLDILISLYLYILGWSSFWLFGRLGRCDFFSWFELEWAEAQVRAGKPGLAMKKALAVHTHFEDFVEDQFDFHTYCMRKVS